uniref:Cytochrome b5 heme-binding domain-containing protein n=1 Tax=Anopheles coluzzii TaxID=1518534 RepID=A0A8W7PVU2_ANOCL
MRSESEAPATKERRPSWLHGRGRVCADVKDPRTDARDDEVPFCRCRSLNQSAGRVWCSENISAFISTCCDRTGIPTMGKTEQPLIVRYKNQWYDLTEFAHKHPGGKNSLTGLHEKDMAERFDRAPGHSQAAKYLMKEYQIKHDPKQKQQNGHSLPNGTKATVNGTTLRNGTKPTGNGLHSAKPHGEGHTTAAQGVYMLSQDGDDVPEQQQKQPCGPAARLQQRSMCRQMFFFFHITTTTIIISAGVA